MGFGKCVWSTGNMMNPFVKRASKKIRSFPTSSARTFDGKGHGQLNGDEEWLIEKNSKTGAIIVDDHLRVQLQTKVPESEPGREPEAPLFRAYLGDVFALGDNANVRGAIMPATAQVAAQQAAWLAKRMNNSTVAMQSFTFKNMGVMTYLGESKGLVQTGGGSGIQGYLAWLVWRGAYLTESVSWRNKVLIPTYWYVLIRVLVL